VILHPNISSDLSIALVGNAESLFDKTFGETIDQHNLVVKINAGATLDKPLSHGARCDLAVFSIPMQFDSIVKDIDTTKIVHASDKDRDTEYNKSYYKIPLQSNLEIRTVARVERPSCGLMTLWWLLKHNPSRIDLYGFDWKATPTWYTKNWYKQPEKHNYDLEQKYILKLCKFGKVYVN